MNTKSNDRGKGIVLSYLNTLLNMICGVFLSSYLIRSLGGTEYGVYQTISSFANYLVLFEFGTGTVMTRNIAVCRSKKSCDGEIKRNISTIWTVTVFLSVIIVIISFLFYSNIRKIYINTMSITQINYAKKMFLFLTAYLVISFYIQTVNGIILAFEKYSLLSLISVIKTIVRTGLLVAVIWTWKYAIMITIIDFSISAVIILFSMGYCKKVLNITFTIKYFDKTVFKSSIGLCVAIFLQVIINQSNNNVDKFLIGIKMAPNMVAIYSVGMYIYSIFSSLTTIPISMYAPEVARNYTNGLRKKELTNSLVEPSRLIVLIGGTVLFGFIAVGKQFICLLYGYDYINAWYIAIVIMIPMFINMSNGVIINVLDVMNKRLSRSFILIFTTIANIIMTVFFLNVWGIVGAAIATAIATMVGQILIMNIYYKKIIGIDVLHLFHEIYAGILGFQILGCVVAFVIGTFISSNILGMMIGGIVYCLISFVGFWFFGANAEEKEKITKIRKKVL